MHKRAKPTDFFSKRVLYIHFSLYLFMNQPSRCFSVLRLTLALHLRIYYSCLCAVLWKLSASLCLCIYFLHVLISSPPHLLTFLLSHLLTPPLPPSPRGKTGISFEIREETRWWGCFRLTITPLWARIENENRQNSHLISHFPSSKGVSKVSKRASERSGASERVSAAELVSEVSNAEQANYWVVWAVWVVWANGRASGPVL